MPSEVEPRLAAAKAEVVPPYLQRNLRLLTAFSSWLAVAVGGTGLLGTILHIPVLRSVLPGHVAIKANTAICLMLIGVAVQLLHKNVGSPRHRTRRVLAQLLCLLVTIVGLLSLGEGIYGWDLGIDQLVIRESANEAIGSIRPGLMSPVAAADFALLGVALLLLDWRPRRFWPAQVLVFLAVIVITFAIYDFLLETQAPHTYIAFPTAVTLFILCFGIIACRSNRGLGGLLASPGLGGTLVRCLFPATILVPALIAYLRWKGAEEGLFSDWFGVCVTSVSAILLLTGLTAATGFLIERTDRDRKKALAELQNSEQRYRSLVVATAQIVWSTDRQGQVVTDMPMWRAFTGMTVEELQGCGWIHALHPDDRECTTEV
jgi:PAS domain-containing protein